MTHRTITKTAEYLKVDCNDVEVMKLVFADGDCVSTWSSEVNGFKFFAYDNASKKYRRKPPGLKASMKLVDSTHLPSLNRLNLVEAARVVKISKSARLTGVG